MSSSPGTPRALPADRVLYRERIGAAAWMWLLWAGLVISVWLALLVVVGPLWCSIVAVAGGALAAAGLVRGAARIEVAGGELRAGRAHIPLPLLGAPQVLDDEAARRLRGPGFEPRAFHLLRSWVPGAVLVDVVDPEDPTPYWYVSSRRPEQLAAAIRAGRALPARP
ncbi:MAG TPA: DUF3093 domain-containing protein [Motilibacteraceae bacterium]|nr:DUF3093 domain-containing protein [Motilibacteraceae bacterium]